MVNFITERVRNGVVIRNPFRILMLYAKDDLLLDVLPTLPLSLFITDYSRPWARLTLFLLKPIRLRVLF